ncbi:hypothetical protein RFI_21781, partial [Reticulomyxa filosa]
MSFRQQVVGLIGTNGLHPLCQVLSNKQGKYIPATGSDQSSTPTKHEIKSPNWQEKCKLFWKFPTMNWFIGSSDTLLLRQCDFGILISVLQLLHNFPLSYHWLFYNILCWSQFLLALSFENNLGPFILQMEPMMCEINFLMAISSPFDCLGL